MFLKTALWPKQTCSLPEDDKSQVVRPAPYEDYQGKQQASASLDRKAPQMNHFFSQQVTISSNWLMWILPILKARHIDTEVFQYPFKFQKMLCDIAFYWISFWDSAYECYLTAESETDYCFLHMAFFFSKLQDSFDISKYKDVQNFGWSLLCLTCNEWLFAHPTICHSFSSELYPSYLSGLGKP